MASGFKDRPLIAASPLLIFFISLAAGGVLHLLFRAPLGSFPEAARLWCGFMLLALAGMVALAAFWALHRHRTPFNPRKATTRVVQSGIFRFSRNPMYLSLALLLSATALLLKAFSFVLVTIVFAVVISRGVIQPEEKYLEEKFGDDYRAYKARVRRWI